jgi:hypothetical protein
MVAWAAGVVGMAGCLDGGRGSDPRHCDAHIRDAVDPDGVLHQYIVSAIRFPTSATEAQQMGFDLDCDPQGRPDNALGEILVLLGRYGEVDLGEETQLLINAGEILHLVEVRTTSVRDAEGVEVLIQHAVDLDGDPSDNFSGSEEFSLDFDRGVGSMTGSVTDGTLQAGAGTIPIAVTLPGLQEPVLFHLIRGTIDVQWTGNTVTGRIGGAVTQDELDSQLIPLLVDGVNRIVRRDCPDGSCEPDSPGEFMLELFDDDGDGTITVAEVLENALIASLLSPDLDLIDERGQLNPRSDGIKDSMSVGFGFDAVGASFPSDP